MKSLVFLFLLIAGGASAQSIQLTPLPTDLYCVGDTITLQYSTKGSFKADNIFIFQRSSFDNVFTSFINLGTSVTASGSLKVPVLDTADHLPFRVYATDPATASNTVGLNLGIYFHPAPEPKARRVPREGHSSISPIIGLIGETIHVYDNGPETGGSNYFWKFGQDASTAVSTGVFADLTYSKIGTKFDTLTVVNAAGCSATKYKQYEIASCDVVIPSGTHIVTGSEAGEYANVWVKAGGNYSPNAQILRQTIFVDPGGSVVSSNSQFGVFYVKLGGSLSLLPASIYNASQGTALLQKGVTVALLDDGTVDTFYCDNINFDTTQVHSGVGRAHPLTISIEQLDDHIEIKGLVGEANAITVFNLLGREVYSKPRTRKATENIDTRSLASGAYYIRVESMQGVLTKGISIVR
ncbi:MAG: T9SS type A sorting domain-containing protein [Candidatus Kapaibacterium sp.]